MKYLIVKFKKHVTAVFYVEITIDANLMEVKTGGRKITIIGKKQ